MKIKLINKIFNPLILWCSGWKRKKEKYAGTYRILYQDPKTKYWWVSEVAIKICEKHLLTNDPRSK